MTGRMDACLLWARAGALGLVAFVLGVVGHVSADGLLPGPAVLAVLLGSAVLLSAPALARPASSLRVVALLVGGQGAIHLALSVTAGHAGDAADAGGGVPEAPYAGALATLPTVGGHRVGSLQDAYTGMSGHGAAPSPALPVGHLIEDLSAHAPMMAVHLVAALLAGLWLAYGERCLWSLLALTGRRVLTATHVLHPTVVVPRLAAIDAEPAPAGPRSVWLVRPDSRRGPPLLAV